MDNTTVNIDSFASVPWVNNETGETVFVLGAGSIGSFLSMFLSRAGFKIVIMDFDKIEARNLGGQLFAKDQVGQYKCYAIKNSIERFSSYDVHAIANHYEASSELKCNFTFSAVDNMQARKDLFENWVVSTADSPVEPIFIDGRLECEMLQIFCVTRNRIKKYRERLFDDDAIEDATCSLKSTTHCSAMIASFMTGYFTNHLTNIYQRDNVRDVPFFFEYFVPLNLVTNG